MTNPQQLSHLSVNQLIFQMGRVIPPYDAVIYNCGLFNAVLNELKNRSHVEIMLVAGESVNKKLFCANNIHYKFGKKYKKSHFSPWLKFKLIWQLNIHKRTQVILPFLHLCLENIQQHVKEGFAVIVLETLENRGIKLAIIDNGTGFLDKNNQPISVEQAILYNYSFGKNGHIGQALWWMVQKKSPVTLIKQAGELAILVPSIIKSQPTFKYIMPLEDTYGTTTIVLFNYHKKPLVTLQGQRLKQEIKQLEEETLSFFST